MLYTTKVHLVNQLVLLGLLTVAEVALRWLHHQSPFRQFTKVGKLEPTAQPEGISACWRVSFPSNSYLNYFPASGLVSKSSLQLSFTSSEWDSQLLLLTLVNLLSVRNFLKLVSCLPSCLGSFLQDGIFQWREAVIHYWLINLQF